MRPSPACSWAEPQRSPPRQRRRQPRPRRPLQPRRQRRPDPVPTPAPRRRQRRPTPTSPRSDAVPPPWDVAPQGDWVGEYGATATPCSPGTSNRPRLAARGQPHPRPGRTLPLEHEHQRRARSRIRARPAPRRPVVPRQQPAPAPDLQHRLQRNAAPVRARLGRHSRRQVAVDDGPAETSTSTPRSTPAPGCTSRST